MPVRETRPQTNQTSLKVINKASIQHRSTKNLTHLLSLGRIKTARGLVYPLMLILLLFFLPSLALSNRTSGGDRLFLLADRLEFDGRTRQIKGQGKVRVQWEKAFFLAEEIEVSLADQFLVASGNIQFFGDQNSYHIQSDSLSLNLEADRWQIQNSRIFIAPFYHLQTDIAEQVEEKKIRFTKASYTACDLDDPAWSIACSRGSIEIDRWAVLRNLTFNIQGQPVFYLPYFQFSVNQDRAPGFLTPEIGRSTLSGVFLGNYYYWPIRTWTDLGFPIDYYEKRGLGLGAEYRYALTNEDSGQMRIYGLYDQQAREKRGDLSLSLQQTMPYQARGVAELTLVSDDDYYRDFKEDMSQRYSHLATSKGYVEKDVLACKARIFTDSAKILNTEAIYRRAPEITLSSSLQSLGSLPLFSTINSSATHFSIRNLDQQNTEMDRLDFFPQLFLPFRGRLITIVPHLSYRLTWYHEHGYRESQMRDLWGGGLDMTGPTWSRSFFSAFTHQWYPRLGLIYERLDGEEKIVKGVDAIDRVRGKRNVVLSLSNRFSEVKEGAGEGAGEGRTYPGVNLFLSQKYSFEHDESFGEGSSTKKNGLSDCEMKISSQIQDYSRYELVYTYAFDYHRTRLVNSTLFFNPKGGFSFDLGWRYNWFGKEAVDEEVSSQGEEIHFLQTGLMVPVTSRWSTKVNLYYDLQKASAIENQFTITYQGSCWSSQFAYIYRFDGQRWELRLALDSLGELNF